MLERRREVDHSTVHRWSLKILPVLTKVFRCRKRLVSLSWRREETYIQVGKEWKYLYRAVDRPGYTVDFLLTAKRDHAAARRFFERAIGLHQSKYLNNLVEQDHRAIKRRTRPVLGFKNFHSATKLITGIETMHMIKKGQLNCPDGQVAAAADQFYSLAF